MHMYARMELESHSSVTSLILWNVYAKNVTCDMGVGLAVVVGARISIAYY